MQSQVFAGLYRSFLCGPRCLQELSVQSWVLMGFYRSFSCGMGHYENLTCECAQYNLVFFAYDSPLESPSQSAYSSGRPFLW